MIGVFIGRFLPMHKEHYRAIVKAGSMVDELYVVVQTNKEYDRLLCDESNIPHIKPKHKLSYVKAALLNIKYIKVISIEYEDESYFGSEDFNNELRNLIGKDFDLVLTSNTMEENEYRMFFGSKVKIIPCDDRNTITSKDIRQAPYKYWEYILGVTRPLFAKRVCITGTESVGKSTLVQSLSKIYNTSWTSEIGGDFYRDNYGSYKDVVKKVDFVSFIAEHQYQFEKALRTCNKILFSDTDIITTQYYYMEEFGNKSEFAEGLIKSGSQDFDVYIFLEPIPADYDQDGVRFNNTDELIEQSRRELIELYKSYGKELIFVGGNRQSRINEVIRICDELINNC